MLSIQNLVFLIFIFTSNAFISVEYSDYSISVSSFKILEYNSDKDDDQDSKSFCRSVVNRIEKEYKKEKEDLLVLFQYLKKEKKEKLFSRRNKLKKYLEKNLNNYMNEKQDFNKKQQDSLYLYFKETNNVYDLLGNKKKGDFQQNLKIINNKMRNSQFEEDFFFILKIYSRSF